MGKEQRKHRRMEIQFDALLTLEQGAEPVEASVLDISEGGAFIEINDIFVRDSLQLAQGAVIRVKILMASKEVMVDTQAEVVYQSNEDSFDEAAISTVEGMDSWVKRGGLKGIGVKFIDLPEEERQFLKNVLLAVE